MKDVIYWSAEAWQAVPESKLWKAWCKILNVQFEENNETENNPNLVKYIKKIPGYASVTADDVEKWATADDNVQEFDDADIAEIVLSAATDDVEECEKEIKEEPKMSYDEAFSVLEKSLEFVEQQTGVTAQELLVFRKWRNFAAEKRVNNKSHQKLITDFFET